MLDNALAKHIEDPLLNGDLAAEPEDPEVRNLVTTVHLTQSALSSPNPSELAESNSRERVLSLLRDGSLSPRDLHKATRHTSSLGERIARWFRRLR